MKRAAMIVMALAMITASVSFTGCADFRDPEIEKRLAVMPEGNEKTAALIQYEQLKAQRAIHYNQPYGWMVNPN